MCTQKHARAIPGTDVEEPDAHCSRKLHETYEITRVATNLKGGAEVLAAVAPDLLEMAHAFAYLIPSVLEAASGFETFASPVMSLLKENIKIYEELKATEKELEAKNALIKELVSELKAYE